MKIKNFIIVLIGVIIIFSGCSDKVSKTSKQSGNNIFLTNFTIDTSDIIVGDSKGVTFNVSLSTDQSLDDVEYVVVKDENENVVTNLYDDGNGVDEVARDGIYSGSDNISSPSKAYTAYYATALGEISNKEYINYYTILTDEEIDVSYEVENTVNSISRQVNNVEEAEQLFGEIISYLHTKKEEGIVEEYYKGVDTIEYKLSSGITCIYTLDTGEEIQNSNSSMTHLISDFSYNIVLSSPVSDGRKDIITLQPYAHELNTSVFDNTAISLASSLNGFTYKSNYDDTDVSISKMKELDEYEVIIIDSHGGYSISQQSPFFGIGDIISKKKDKELSADIGAGRILRLSGGQYGVTAKFFDEYYKGKSFNNTLFYLGFCHGADDNTLASSLLSIGAGGVYAYKNSVYSSYNRNMFKTIFSELINLGYDGDSGELFSKAFQTAKKLHGDEDPTISKLEELRGKVRAELFLYEPLVRWDDKEDSISAFVGEVKELSGVLTSKEVIERVTIKIAENPEFLMIYPNDSNSFDLSSIGLNITDSFAEGRYTVEVWVKVKNKPLPNKPVGKVILNVIDTDSYNKEFDKYMDLAFEYRRQQLSDSRVLENFNNALEYALLDEQKSEVYWWIGDYYRNTSSYQKAYEIYEIALEYAPDNYHKSAAYWGLGISAGDINRENRTIENANRAINNYKKALEYAADNDQKSGAYQGIGSIYSLMSIDDESNYDKALENYEKALEFAESDFKKSFQYERIGYIYEVKGLYDKALESYTKGLEFATSDYQIEEFEEGIERVRSK